MTGSVEIRAPASDELEAAERLLAEAFLDDPAWVATGPRARDRRRASNRIWIRGLLRASSRHEGRTRVAIEGSEVVGAAVSFGSESWPPPARGALLELRWLLAVGPLAAIRGVRDDLAMRDSHPSDPHVYLWFIGVGPSAQGRGIGRALIEDAIEFGRGRGHPVYLETATAENAAMYRHLGFELLGEIELPSGVRMRRMVRPPAPAG